MENLHKDHRKRMYRKAEEMGLQNMEEHEVLEIILYAIVPRGNTNEIAKRMIAKFGNVANVLKADEKELVTIDGVGSTTAKFIRNLYDVLGVVERCAAFSEKKIENSADAIDYVKPFFNGKCSEQFYMVSLNKNGGIISSHWLSSGISDEVHIYPQIIARKALMDEAHSVIIAHNHPGGTLSVSFADENMTIKIKKTLDVIGIKLFDSLIIAGGKGISVLNQLM
ncbi:MAG: hypothetical protein E7415_03345 [Ruminococcaceae bacterium]|nr:hypothetical protein [Oscillospiraceae bacterium]